MIIRLRSKYLLISNLLGVIFVRKNMTFNFGDNITFFFIDCYLKSKYDSFYFSIFTWNHIQESRNTIFPMQRPLFIDCCFCASKIIFYFRCFLNFWKLGILNFLLKDTSVVLIWRVVGSRLHRDIRDFKRSLGVVKFYFEDIILFEFKE